VSGDKRLEVEVKFLVRDLERLRERLLEQGAQVTVQRTHEYNVRYDTPEGTLLERRQLLRLRQDRDVVVTFKGEPPAGSDSTEAKVREELEVTVSDFETMDLILQRVGFARAQVYEKYRETMAVNGVEAVLDQMPYGDFVELEGPEEKLRPLAEALGLNWSRRLLTNYLALMERLKAARGLSFDDVTFDNFASTSASMADIEPPAD
jgi:adenylate cyclase class 2